MTTSGGMRPVALDEALASWQGVLAQVRTETPTAARMAHLLAADIRDNDQGVSPAELLARLAARLNAITVAAGTQRAETIILIIGFTAAELAAG